MENETVSMTFDNTVADHLEAERLYYKSTFLAKLDKIVAIALLCVGLAAIASAGVRWWTLVFFPLAVLEWFNLLSLRPLMIRWWFARNPKFRETYHLAFDRTGIQFRTGSIDSRLAWDHYTSVLEDGRLWLLVYGAHMYTVIPKRAFASESDMTRFRSLVAECITRKGRQAG